MVLVILEFTIKEGEALKKRSSAIWERRKTNNYSRVREYL